MPQCQHRCYYLMEDIVCFPGLINHTGLYWICGHCARKGLLLNTTDTCTLGQLLTHAEVHHILSAELAHSLPRCTGSLNPLVETSRPGWKVFQALFPTLELIELEAAIINISQTTESMSSTTTNAILALQEVVSGVLKVALQNQLASIGLTR